MKILIAGSSGLVGRELQRSLIASNHQLTRLVRRNVDEEELAWNPARGELDASRLGEFDGIIHLGGENIAEGRWSAAKKKQIRDSRVESTALLAKALAATTPRPKFFVCASAIGYYGNRGDEVLTEDAPPGTGFLADVCQEWENATLAATEAGVRVVNVRIGVVLSKDGGALKNILLPFRLGGGGIVGNGKQYWSCVPLPELASMFRFCVEHESISGPVNAVTPGAPTNYEFTKALGRVLKRPTIVPLPGFMAKLMLGEMAEDLLLASTRVDPRKLRDAGYEFQHTDIESSLRSVLD